MQVHLGVSAESDNQMICIVTRARIRTCCVCVLFPISLFPHSLHPGTYVRAFSHTGSTPARMSEPFPTQAPPRHVCQSLFPHRLHPGTYVRAFSHTGGSTPACMSEPFPTQEAPPRHVCQSLFPHRRLHPGTYVRAFSHTGGSTPARMSEPFPTQAPPLHICQ